MNTLHQALPRMLYGVAACFTLAGAALWVLPARELSAPPAGDVGSGVVTPSLGAGAVDSAAAAAILEGNLLSDARRPPRTRLRPAGESVAAEAPRPRAAVFQPRLFGTVVGTSDPSALIDADPRVPGAEVYRLGDQLLGRRLTEINDSNVVLEGPAGRLVLQLERTRGPSR